jgi:hypothetical protein
LIAPANEVLMKLSENLIVSSKLTIPVPKFATKPVVLSPGVIVPRSNVDAAAGRPASPSTNKLANRNATSRFIGPILLPESWSAPAEKQARHSTIACGHRYQRKRAGKWLGQKLFYDIGKIACRAIRETITQLLFQNTRSGLSSCGIDVALGTIGRALHWSAGGISAR